MLVVFNSGGTNTRVGISADGEAIINTTGFETIKDFDGQIKKLTDTFKTLLGGDKPRGIAGGAAGVWDGSGSKLIKSPNLPDWENRPMRASLEKEFDCQVKLYNDALLEGLGEAKSGAGRRKRIVAYVSIGTGIGGVKIEDGKVCAYTYGFEPGHQIIDVEGEVGYWESFASGTAIERMYGRKPENITEGEIWEKEIRLLAIGIHNLTVLWSPEIVILGGGVAPKIDLSKLKSVLSEQMTRFPKIPELAYAELKENAGMYGALSVFKAG